MSQVFISYASEDREIAHEIKRQLNQAVIDSFYDQDMKEAPDVKEWRDFLRNKILECSCMLVIITPELWAITKGNVIWEWSIMDGRRDENVIIPVAFDVSLNELNGSRLGDYQGISFNALNDDDAWNILFNRIQAIFDNYARDPYVAQAELLLHSAKPDERHQAQQYLLYFDHADAKNALLRAVKSRNTEVSLEAAKTLIQLEPLNPDPHILEGIKKAIIDHQIGRSFFREGLEVLRDLQIPEVGDTFLEILNAVSKERSRKKIIDVLVVAKAPFLCEVMFDLLRSRHQRLTPENIAQLLSRLKDCTNEELEPNTELLLEIMLELPKKNTIKGIVAEMLGRVGDPDVVMEPIVSVLQEHKERDDYRANLVVNTGCIRGLINLGEQGNRKLRELWHQGFYYYIQDAAPQWKIKDWGG